MILDNIMEKNKLEKYVKEKLAYHEKKSKEAREGNFNKSEIFHHGSTVALLHLAREFSIDLKG